MDIGNDVQTTSGSPKPCESLWFPDGNVVIATDTLLFKVHKGVLSLQSSVFKDMFELPIVESGLENTQEGQGTVGFTPELYEGLPLVGLAGDTGKDVEHLLRAVYERHYFRPERDDTDLDTVNTLLLLSKKYDFKHIQKDVVAHVLRHHPMSLEEQMKLKEIEYHHRKEWSVRHLKLLKAAVFADIDFLLPLIYYACSDYSIGDILRAAKLVQLDQGTLDTLIEGREEVGSMIRHFIAEVPFTTYIEFESNDCEREGSCLEEIRFFQLGDFFHSTSMKNLSTSDFFVFDRCRTDLCKLCREAAEDAVDRERMYVWDRIPRCFGFPGWDVLRTKMEEFLK
ncbi:hypothetical protein SCHPADRAFT_883121 [Schizopora paradoxa]|uniref:BTB domain-containing protein n=1 Tax=Schizopora paradoxa TaxID=27342 RepID=A0A0H2R9H0_9AGAM|nr:hypothetical protein SCHPADRAFT_883121 [Schizopora paradoxa]